MEKFLNKFISLVNDYKDGNLLLEQLDKFVKENKDKKYFSDAIKKLMDNEISWVMVLAAKYSLEYKIDIKKSYFVSRYILRREKDINCRLEAKQIYDTYRKRHINKITKIIRRKKTINN